jgi:hypothetical protein
MQAEIYLGFGPERVSEKIFLLFKLHLVNKEKCFLFPVYLRRDPQIRQKRKKN